MTKKNNTTDVPLFSAEFREIVQRFDAEPELDALLEKTDAETGDGHGTDTDGDDGEAVS